jgi:hypothetical protein
MLSYQKKVATQVNIKRRASCIDSCVPFALLKQQNAVVLNRLPCAFLNILKCMSPYEVMV